MTDVQMHKPTLIAVSRLKPHPRNYRTHPPDQREHLVQSMREHGFYRNVVVADDLTILAGHGVVEAAAEAGIEKVLAVKLSISPDHPKALKLLAADNETGRLAVIDDRRLTELLKEVGTVDVDGLLGTGYNAERLAQLIASTTHRPSMDGIQRLDRQGNGSQIVLVYGEDDMDLFMEYVRLASSRFDLHDVSSIVLRVMADVSG